MEEQEHTCFNEEYLRFAEDMETPCGRAVVGVLCFFAVVFIAAGLSGILMDIHPTGIFTTLFGVGLVMFLIMLLAGSIFLIGYCTLPKPKPRKRRIVTGDPMV
jgi:hypothetical protein